jgi:hypothetical protein
MAISMTHYVVICVRFWTGLYPRRGLAMGIKITSADTHFSRCIRLRVDWTCEHCGAHGWSPYGNEGVKLECCHIVGRREAVTRWDALNCISMCHMCHRQFTENPLEFADWIRSKWPDRWQILQEKRRHHIKNNAATRQEVSAHYLNEYKRMERTGARDLVSWI